MSRKRAIVYLVIAAVLWSIGGLFIKLVDWNPMAIAGTRSGIAAIVILVYLRKPIKRLGRYKLLGAFSYAALLILFVTANKLTTSANAILLQFTAPIWVALFSGWFLKEKARISDWATVFAVMMGMILFFIGDLGTGNSIGNFVAVFSGIAMAAMVIFMKMQDEGSPVETALVGNVLTLVVSLPFLFFSSFPSWSSILALLVLGIFQLGISYIFYTIAIKHVSALEAILIPIIEPLLNPIWVLWFTGESPSGYAFLGGVIIIIAIVARNLYQQKKRDSFESTSHQA